MKRLDLERFSSWMKPATDRQGKRREKVKRKRREKGKRQSIERVIVNTTGEIMLSERKFENLVCLSITFCMFSNFLTFSSHLLPFELENFLGIFSQKSLRTLEREV